MLLAAAAVLFVCVCNMNNAKKFRIKFVNVEAFCRPERIATWTRIYVAFHSSISHSVFSLALVLVIQSNSCRFVWCRAVGRPFFVSRSRAHTTQNLIKFTIGSRRSDDFFHSFVPRAAHQIGKPLPCTTRRLNDTQRSCCAISPILVAAFVSNTKYST